MPSPTLTDGRAPPLDGVGDDRDGCALRAFFQIRTSHVECGLNRLRIVTVDHFDDESGGFKLLGGHAGGLLAGDTIGLTVAVAVEDGDDGGELVVDDEIDGLPDLTFS